MQTAQSRRTKALALTLSASMLTLFLVGLTPQLLAASPNGSGGATLYPVQVSIQTKNSTVASYDLVAYNSTGAQVASYTGLYPQMTFDLPSGAYLLAATANGPSPVNPPVCFGASQSGGAAPPAAGSKSVAGANIAYPCYYANPPMEYGYVLAQVSSATTLTISTQPQSQVPTAAVSVSVSFKNGTAAAGAEVSATVVGSTGYWGGNTNLNMDNQTGPDGVAHLVVPAVPIALTAYDDVQVNLPKNQTTIQVTVGGEPVNVTVYYSPNYVYLTSSALLVPPQRSVSMVLAVQTQPRLIPYAVGSSTSAGVAKTPAGAPSSSSQGPASSQGAGGAAQTATQLTSIPPIPASAIPRAQSSNPPVSGLSLVTIGTIAIAGVAAAAVGVAISRRKG